MAKSPNYSFEKRERERAKAQKATDRAAAKLDQRDGGGAPAEAAPSDEPQPKG